MEEHLLQSDLHANDVLFFYTVSLAPHHCLSQLFMLPLSLDMCLDDVSLVGLWSRRRVSSCTPISLLDVLISLHTCISGTIVLYDGSPFHPSPNELWDLVDEHHISVFGASAKYYICCTPRFDCSSLVEDISHGHPRRALRTRLHACLDSSSGCFVHWFTAER